MKENLHESKRKALKLNKQLRNEFIELINDLTNNNLLPKTHKKINDIINYANALETNIKNIDVYSRDGMRQLEHYNTSLTEIADILPKLKIEIRKEKLDILEKKFTKLQNSFNTFIQNILVSKILDRNNYLFLAQLKIEFSILTLAMENMNKNYKEVSKREFNDFFSDSNKIYDDISKRFKIIKRNIKEEASKKEQLVDVYEQSNPEDDIITISNKDFTLNQIHYEIDILKIACLELEELPLVDVDNSFLVSTFVTTFDIVRNHHTLDYLEKTFMEYLKDPKDAARLELDERIILAFFKDDYNSSILKKANINLEDDYDLLLFGNWGEEMGKIKPYIETLTKEECEQYDEAYYEEFHRLYLESMKQVKLSQTA